MVEAARLRLAVIDGLRRWARGSLSDQAAVELLTSYANGRHVRPRGGVAAAVCPGGLVLARRRLGIVPWQ
jgi:hypothetical protein